ncbi:unnamed protein product [Pedinophyceae sp. YPF-701]|nr:unnamed protein product [Pedinophyceae sp. YPF-701]
MGKGKKSVKKFSQKGHLRNAIKSRHENQKRKRWQAEKNAKLVAKAREVEQEEAQAKKRPEDMSVDDFLDNGWKDIASDPLEPGPASDASSSDHDEESNLDEISSEDEPSASEESSSESGEDGSDDEQGTGSESSDDMDEGPAPAARRKAKGGAIDQHRAELEALKARDPEFYKYLEDVDKDLLKFGDDGMLDDSASGSDSDDDDDDDGPGGDQGDGGDDDEAGERRDGPPALALTSSEAKKICRNAASRGSPAAMKHLLQAYRAACHYGDEDPEGLEGSRMIVTSASVFNRVVVFTLREAHGIFCRMLNVDPAAKKLTPQAVTKAGAKWKKIEPLVRSYFGNTMHLLGAATDRALTILILRRLRPSVALLTPIPGLTRAVLRAATSVFSSGERSARLEAFMLIREMAMSLPQPMLDNAIKALVRAYAGAAKFMNPSSAPHLGFMGTCIVEVLNVDLQTAYAFGYNYIRQLAQRLRTSLTARTKDAYLDVYNWQFMNCVELWARVVAAHADKTEMRHLIYPVTEILFGMGRLIPTPRYFPLRLRCARILNRVLEATKTYAPVGRLLQDMLTYSGFKKKLKTGAKGSNASSADLAMVLKVSKKSVDTAAFQVASIEGILEGLVNFLAIHAGSVAFPELAFPILRDLKSFVKDAKLDRVRKPVKEVITAVERNIEFIGQQRQSVTFSPKDVEEADKFEEEMKATGKLAMVKLDKQMQARAAERTAALRTTEVVLKAGEGDAALDADGSGEDEEELEAEVRGESDSESDGSDGAEEDEEEEEDSEDDERVGAEVDFGAEEDRLEDFVMSDSEDESGGESDEDARAPVGGKAGGKVRKEAKKRRMDASDDSDEEGAGGRGQNRRVDFGGRRGGRGGGRGRGRGRKGRR